MIKYILHGGQASDQNAENDNFFREILKDLPSNAKILLVNFASEPEKNEKNIFRGTSQFNRVKADRNLIFDVAKEESFEEQILNADAIYFCGGTTVRILRILRKFSNLKQLFNGKTVAGESAGANAFATMCYSKSGGGIIECLGFLPIITICHYKDGDEKKLKDVPKNLEILLLKEYEFKVIYS